ncbi:MAG TPA: class I SAM-dependent methyltransferase [Gaiellaceae bacterium]|nr:class I SAM-dependent methyltransferase [Gaiellaceae bacterium]
MPDVFKRFETDIGRWYRTDEAVAEYEAAAELKDAEPALLARMRAEGLEQGALLDVGVGGGRTTVHFAPHARTYVGVDYSPPLVEACRRRFADSGWDHVRFEVADARDLAQFEDGSFDFTLFSVNGIDAIAELDDRLRALRELHRVTRRDGLFAFSAHNLQWAPSVMALRPAPKDLARAVLLRALNGSPRRLADKEHAVLAEHRLGRRFGRHFFVRPREQVRQLESVGFRDVEVLGPDGTALTAEQAARHVRHWCYYVCRA